MKKLLLVTVFITIICGFSVAQTSITLQPFASGFSNPVDLKSAGDDRLFVVEQEGRIRIMDTLGNKNSGYFLDIESRVLSGGEMGLLGLAFDPDFAANGYFYVNYIDNSGDTKISRFVVSATNPDSAISDSEKVILQINQPVTTNHKGGDLAFGPDGYLYIGMGDGGGSGDPNNFAQNMDSLLGKMLRIDVNSFPYIIPSTNPFVGDSSARGEIWASGLRNPWKWSFDRLTGDLWIGDVGQNLYEEIDFQQGSSAGGENYGWRCYEGNHPYNTSGCNSISTYTSPVLEVDHSSACAVIGGYVYRGAEYGNMYGKYFFTDQCLENIKCLEADSGGTFNVTDLGDLLPAASSNVAFGEDKWGELYLVTHGGSIYKLKGQDCTPLAEIAGEDTLVVCADSMWLSTPSGRGFHYEWNLNGNSFGPDSASILVNQSGSYKVTVTSRNGCQDTSNVVYVDLTDTVGVSITGLDSSYCVSDSSVVMTGTPSGGTFSGPGVIGSTFYPSMAGTGTHEITYAFDNGNNCPDSITYQLVVDTCSTIGVDERMIESFQLYPNPNSGDFVYSFLSIRDQKIDIEIINVLGRVVYTNKTELKAGIHQQSLSLKDLSRGVYLFRIRNGEKAVSHTFIVD